jgi:Uncharacterised nucleotidyltransferase
MNRAAALRNIAALFQGRPLVRPDWPALIALACEEMIAAEVHDALIGAGAAIPGEFSAFLTDVSARTRERTRRLARTLDDVLIALKAAAVTPLLLKGCALWTSLADPAPKRNRLMSDLDLLVEPGLMQTAIDALTDHGFATIEDARTQAHDVVVLGRPQDPGSIDLHQRPPGPRGALTFADLVRNASPADADARALRPAAELQVMIAVLHDQMLEARYWRGGFHMRHLLDIADLIGRADPFDWEALRSLVKSPLIDHALRAELWAAHRLAGAAQPPRAFCGFQARLHYARQRAQFNWPGINGLSRRIGLASFVWKRVNTRYRLSTKE